MKTNPAIVLVGLAMLALPMTPLRGNAASAAPQSTALAPASSTTGAADSIPPGTVITMRNWAQFQNFMPDGMIALFQGKYFWKMPADVEMRVGPTIIHPLPEGYRTATEKYAAQVRIVHQADGVTELIGYQGGQPFPSPSGPDQGWEILANLWFRYLPHLFVDSRAAGCLQNRYGNIDCSAYEIVYRQLSYNTDPGIPTSLGADGKYFTEWLMTVAPEHKKYTASLSIAYNDITRDQDSYAFIPALRRYQAVSASARCSPAEGTDVTSDDFRFGFNGVIGHFQASFLGARKILALTDYSI
ncbi:MAG: DUF1329 domain-containing protein, partial [Roseiarcus sp.]